MTRGNAAVCGRNQTDVACTVRPFNNAEVHLPGINLELPLTAVQVAETFNAQKTYPVVPKNAAPHSGALAWVRGLRERITGKYQLMQRSCHVALRGL